jgi:hypothetical protein
MKALLLGNWKCNEMQKVSIESSFQLDNNQNKIHYTCGGTILIDY